MLSPRQTTSLSPRGEVARHPDDLGDPAGLDLHLVGEIEVEERLVGRAGPDAPVAEQVDEVARVLLAGHEQHLADPEPLQELERVVDHRPAADRQQVLVRDARQLLETRRLAAGADQTLHDGDRHTPARCYSGATAGFPWLVERRGPNAHEPRERSAAATSSSGRGSPSGSGRAGSARSSRRRRSRRRGRARTPAGRRCCPATKPENAAHMMIAAAVMIRPVRSSPWATAVALSQAVVPGLAHPRDEEDLVVHREPEEHREEEDRDPALDLAELVEPEEALPDAVAEEDDEHAVARAATESRLRSTAFSGRRSERNARMSRK